MMHMWWREGRYESVFIHSPDKGSWACVGDLPQDHALTGIDFSFAVQFNAERPWPSAKLRYPRVDSLLSSNSLAIAERET